RVYFAKYEDLVADPHKIFADMVGFVGQPLDQALFERTIDDVQAAKFKTVNESKKSNILKAPFVRNGRNRQWEAEMTAADIDWARAVFLKHGSDLDETMEKWGLPLPPRPADAPPIPIEALEDYMRDRKPLKQAVPERAERLAEIAAEKRSRRAAAAEARKARDAQREARVGGVEAKAALRAEKQQRVEAARAERRQQADAVREARRAEKAAKAAEVRAARRAAREEVLKVVPASEPST
ncbi:MAG TPA: sulfotransferase domain-containing protein, partial [Caulobacteraceae bacterium]|nr:sulfotransferase domain-containing protein [Caulobacteraceae bacterium]